MCQTRPSWRGSSDPGPRPSGGTRSDVGTSTWRPQLLLLLLHSPLMYSRLSTRAASHRRSSPLSAYVLLLPLGLCAISLEDVFSHSPLIYSCLDLGLCSISQKSQADKLSTLRYLILMALGVLMRPGNIFGRRRRTSPLSGYVLPTLVSCSIVTGRTSPALNSCNSAHRVVEHYTKNRHASSSRLLS